MSATLDYVPVVISHACLQSLWTLTLSENEWAGRLVLDRNCQAGCNVDLIEGGVLEDVTDRRKSLYRGNDSADDSKPVRVASVIIPNKEFTKLDACVAGSANILFHTHPLLLVRDIHTHVARIALPSMGDIFVNCVFGNILNYERTGHVNCNVVIAFEGVYVYFILPYKFQRIYEQWGFMLRSGMSREQAAAALETQTFDELRPANQLFFKKMKAFCDANADAFGTDGAPDIRNAMWHCKGCAIPDLLFPYADAIRTSLVRDWARSNPMTASLNEHGFHCEFYPAPFETDLTILAPSKLTFIDGPATR